MNVCNTFVENRAVRNRRFLKWVWLLYFLLLLALLFSLFVLQYFLLIYFNSFLFKCVANNFFLSLPVVNGHLWHKSVVQNLLSNSTTIFLWMGICGTGLLCRVFYSSLYHRIINMFLTTFWYWNHTVVAFSTFLSFWTQSFEVLQWLVCILRSHWNQNAVFVPRLLQFLPHGTAAWQKFWQVF